MKFRHGRELNLHAPLSLTDGGHNLATHRRDPIRKPDGHAPPAAKGSQAGARKM
jgi:hypothetical protein